jgi:general stress protein 26
VNDPAPRSLEARRQDTLKRLATDVDAWVSTASADGTPYLMPLSFLWEDGTLLLSTAKNNPTSLNLQANPLLHLSIGETRDVVLITATAEVLRPDQLTPETGDTFATKAGFDPRAIKSPYLYFRVTPVRIQAWREVNELPNRDLMLNGTWLP